MEQESELGEYPTGRVIYLNGPTAGRPIEIGDLVTARIDGWNSDYRVTGTYYVKRGDPPLWAPRVQIDEPEYGARIIDSRHVLWQVIEPVRFTLEFEVPHARAVDLTGKPFSKNLCFTGDYFDRDDAERFYAALMAGLKPGQEDSLSEAPVVEGKEAKQFYAELVAGLNRGQEDPTSKAPVDTNTAGGAEGPYSTAIPTLESTLGLARELNQLKGLCPPRVRDLVKELYSQLTTVSYLGLTLS